jgi:diadenosine tetraphosphate (Ap4A) HIT family hydrolase
MSKSKKCPFCYKPERRKEGKILDEGDLWYALIPKDPEIFGHIIVTYSDEGKHCIRNIWEVNSEDEKRILNSMIEGVRTVSEKMINIGNSKLERMGALPGSYN